jgi:hypothetical protein
MVKDFEKWLVKTKEKVNSRMLTDREIRVIRKVNGKGIVRRLSNKYGVSQSKIRRIRAFKI